MTANAHNFETTHGATPFDFCVLCEEELHDVVASFKGVLKIALLCAPSMSSLADALNVSRGTIARLLRGAKSPTIDLCIVTAKYAQWMLDPERLEKEPKVFLAGDIKFLTHKRHCEWLAHISSSKIVGAE